MLYLRSLFRYIRFEIFFFLLFSRTKRGLSLEVFLVKEVCTSSTFKITPFEDISDYNKSIFMVRNVNFFLKNYLREKKWLYDFVMQLLQSGLCAEIFCGDQASKLLSGF